MLTIEVLQQIEFRPLLLRRRAPRHVRDRLAAGHDTRALVQNRQEVRAPNLPAGVRDLRRDDHKGGEVLVEGAQTVTHPGSDAGPIERRRTRVNPERCPEVVAVDVLHRADHGNLVSHLADLREQVADFDAALSVPPELPVRALVDPVFAERFVVVLPKERLGVERVHVGHAARHEQEDDLLRFRGEVRVARS